MPATRALRKREKRATEQLLSSVDWAGGLYLHLSFSYPADPVEAQSKTRHLFDALSGVYKQPLTWAAASSPNPSSEDRHHVHGLLSRPEGPGFVTPSFVQSKWREGFSRVTRYDPERAGRPERYIALNAAEPGGQLFLSKAFRSNYSDSLPERSRPPERSEGGAVSRPTDRREGG